MEIITYMDNRKTSYRPQARLVRKPENTRKNQRFGLTPRAVNMSRRNREKVMAAVHERSHEQMERVLEGAKLLWWYVTHRSFKVLLLLAMVAMGFCLSAGMREIGRQLASIARPVELPYLPTEELKILDGAMSRFALIDDREVDADGNILIDGEEVALADISFNQPVSFQSYTVQSGDTISGITYRFGLTNISTLIAVNDIGNVRQLRSGQRLRVPSMDGLMHNVVAGETLEGLSARYEVAVEDILDVNDLDSAALLADQQLFIPGAKMDSARLQQAMGELFIWPLSGGYRITSRFGRRLDPFTGVPSSHTGIDLAMAQGTPIKAAMSGKIAVAGYTNVYGNYVIIDHENGYQTMYAHLHKPAPVKKGQRVAQGTRIGAVGNTGYSTGPHLHFTVYKNGRLIDPETVLK